MMVDLSSIEQVLRADARIVSAYVLGSAAEGRMRAYSDVDIAILPAAGRGFSPVDILELSAVLSLAVGRTVDVGMLSSHNLIYASQALLKGRRFFCRDTFAADLAAATLLGLAVQFHFERKEVVDEYAA